MAVEVTVPEEHMGTIIGDINSRRGRIEGMDHLAGSQVIKAIVPLKEMFGYVNDIRSSTQGRASYSYSLGHQANMVNPAFTDTGVAVTQGADGTFFVTQIFTPRRRRASGCGADGTVDFSCVPHIAASRKQNGVGPLADRRQSRQADSQSACRFSICPTRARGQHWGAFRGRPVNVSLYAARGMAPQHLSKAGGAAGAGEVEYAGPRWAADWVGFSVGSRRGRGCWSSASVCDSARARRAAWSFRRSARARRWML